MSALNFICNAASRLITRIEYELLIDSQQSHFKCPLPDSVDVIIMRYKMFSYLLDNVRAYLSCVRSLANDTCPFKCAVSIHTLSLEKIEADLAAEVMQEHQSVLSTATNIPLPENATNPEEAVTSVMNFFPFHTLMPLLKDQSFFVDLIKIVIKFNGENIKTSVKNVYKLLESTKLPHFSKIAVAEVLLDYFIADEKLKKVDVGELSNYRFLENCKLLIKSGHKQLSISDESITKFFDDIKTPNKNEKMCINYSPPSDLVSLFDDDGIQMEMGYIEHIWIEIRRMTVAPSTTAALSILAKANIWLRKSLTVKSKDVGADEIFQFFVAALVNAKILNLPTLVESINKYSVADIVSPSYAYLRTSLSSAVEFIQTRQVNVPPYLIFPFDSTDNKDIVREGDNHVILRRFTIYSYPSFVDAKFKSFLYYTGNQNDTAIGYLYSASLGINESLVTLGDKCETVPTSEGSIFQLDQEEISRGRMININDGDYESHITDINIISNISLMVPIKAEDLCLTNINSFLSEFQDQWRMTQHVSKGTIISIVKHLQNALVSKGHTEIQVDGVIRKNMINVIKKLMTGFKKNEFFINQKVYNFVIKYCTSETKDEKA